MERVIRVLTWLVFGVGFVFAVLIAVLASLTGRPLFAQPGGVRSKVKVAVPQDDASVKINDTPTKTAGASRVYDTPELEAGKRYKYTVVAVWKPDAVTTRTRSRTVVFTAGDEVPVDLTVDDGTDKATVDLKPLTDDAIDDVVKTVKPGKDDVVVMPVADVRPLIAMVKAGAKKGVAVIPDPETAKAAKLKILAAEMDQKIEVRTDEPTAASYADATVVLLYAGDTVNAMLRPALLRDLKTGARIVSYQYGLGDYKAGDTKKGVNAAGDKYDLLTWKVTDDDKKKYGKK